LDTHYNYNLQYNWGKEDEKALFMFIDILVSIATGFTAGLAAGISGISAALIISPILFTFVGVPTYQAVGIALASDIFSSTASTITYGSNHNVDFRGGLYILLIILFFTAIGSYIGAFVPNYTVGFGLMASTIFLGTKFIVSPVTNTPNMLGKPSRKYTLIAIVSGVIIGLINGIFGAGGGLLVLLILVCLLQYELKIALGTSLFIMAFTALVGALSHFIIGGIPDVTILITCICSAFAGAWLSSIFANKISAKALNRIIGVFLLGLGIAMILKQFYGMLK
jgi:uncharacterized membrane protein YfcA